jgi:hypothetical protein
MAAETDMVFRFVNSTDPNADSDARTFRVYQVIGTAAHEELELYRVRPTHPSTKIHDFDCRGSFHIHRLAHLAELQLISGKI